MSLTKQNKTKQINENVSHIERDSTTAKPKPTENIYNKTRNVVPQSPKYKQLGATHQKAQDLVLESVRGSNRTTSDGLENRKTPKEPISTYWKTQLSNLNSS